MWVYYMFWMSWRVASMSSCNILLRSCSARNSSVKQGVRHTRRLKFKKKQVNIILSKKKTFLDYFHSKKNYYHYYFLFFKKKFKTNNYTFKSVHFLLQFLHGSFSKFSTGLGLKYSKFDVKCKK